MSYRKEPVKLLVIDEGLPYPPDSGKRIRTFNLLKHLARDIDIVYLSFGSDSAASSEAIAAMNSLGVDCRIVEQKLQEKSGVTFGWKLFVNLFSRYPYIVTSHFKSKFLERLTEIIADFDPAIVLAEWTPYAKYLDGLENVKKIVVAHNIESRIWRRYHENESNLLKKVYIGIQAGRVERFEQEIWRNVDGIISVSPLEKKEIESRADGVPVELVENGVDTDYFAPSNETVERGSLVFVGSMDWRPNQDAAEHFIKSIFPLIKKEIDGARAYIVGRKPPSFIRGMAAEDVVITGTVDDVRPYLEKASVMVVPLRVGGGSRLKILEAMAMRKPVASTSVGAEGLEVSDGENIVLADGPERFAAACCELLKNKKAASSIAKNGYSLAVERYRWEILAGKMKAFLTGMAGG
jgi:sugar transferase (PEP-CTERM/EpsH1 system associated)